MEIETLIQDIAVWGAKAPDETLKDVAEKFEEENVELLSALSHFMEEGCFTRDQARTVPTYAEAYNSSRAEVMKIASELADVAILLFRIADKLDLDLLVSVGEKFEDVKRRYPNGPIKVNTIDRLSSDASSDDRPMNDRLSDDDRSLVFCLIQWRNKEGEVYYLAKPSNPESLLHWTTAKEYAFAMPYGQAKDFVERGRILFDGTEVFKSISAELISGISIVEMVGGEIRE